VSPISPPLTPILTLPSRSLRSRRYLALDGRDFASGSFGPDIVGSGFAKYQRTQFMLRYGAGGMLSGNVVDGYEENVNDLDDVADVSELNSFAFISFNSSLPLKVNEMTLAEMRTTMEAFQAHIDEHNAEHPYAQAMQFCLLWYFMIAGEAVVANSFSGIAISISFAFVVLCIANWNWLVAVLAITSIVGVVAVVALSMVRLGGDLAGRLSSCVDSFCVDSFPSPAAGVVRGVSPRQPEILPASAAAEERFERRMAVAPTSSCSLRSHPSILTTTNNTRTRSRWAGTSTSSEASASSSSSDSPWTTLCTFATATRTAPPSTASRGSASQSSTWASASCPEP
jgi:hypothetical protein